MTRWLRRRKSDRRERRRRERREEREAEEAQRQQALSTQIPMVYQVLIILYDPVIFFVLPNTEVCPTIDKFSRE